MVETERKSDNLNKTHTRGEITRYYEGDFPSRRKSNKIDKRVARYIKGTRQRLRLHFSFIDPAILVSQDRVEYTSFTVGTSVRRFVLQLLETAWKVMPPPEEDVTVPKLRDRFDSVIEWVHEQVRPLLKMGKICDRLKKAKRDKTAPNRNKRISGEQNNLRKEREKLERFINTDERIQSQSPRTFQNILLGVEVNPIRMGAKNRIALEKKPDLASKFLHTSDEAAEGTFFDERKFMERFYQEADTCLTSAIDDYERIKEIRTFLYLLLLDEENDPKVTFPLEIDEGSSKLRLRIRDLFHRYASLCFETTREKVRRKNFVSRVIRLILQKFVPEPAIVTVDEKPTLSHGIIHEVIMRCLDEEISDPFMNRALMDGLNEACGKRKRRRTKKKDTDT